MKKGSSLEFLLKRRDRAVSRCVNADDKESSWVINSIFLVMIVLAVNSSTRRIIRSFSQEFLWERR